MPHHAHGPGPARCRLSIVKTPASRRTGRPGRRARQTRLLPGCRTRPRRRLTTAGELGAYAQARSYESRGSRRRSVLAGQHEHRNLPRGPGLVFADRGILRDQLRPQLGPAGAVQFLRQYRERLGTHLACDPGVGLEVVVPVRVGWRPSVRGDDRETAVSLKGAAQRRDALGPGPGADLVDKNQRGAGPWPADAALVRPELLNHRGIKAAGPARSRVRSVFLMVIRHRVLSPLFGGLLI